MFKKTETAACLLLIGMTLAVYSPVINSGFLWDDDAYVTENQTLRSLAGLKSIWLEPYSLPQYYPLVHTSFWVEYHLWGLSPAGYHLVNILLHAFNALLLWQVLKILKVPGAALAGFVFALHPVHVESVAWITERKNVLSLFFYLLALLSYLRFGLMEEPGARKERQWKFYGLALLFFICALFSKTVTCSLPAALLLLCWWKQGRIGRRDVFLMVPMLVLGLCSALLTVWLERTHVGARGVDWTLTFLERCLIAGRAIWFYAGKLVFPINLSFIYTRWVPDPRVWWQYVYPLSALSAVFLLYCWRRRLGRGPVTALLYFAGSLFPALGFFDVYPMLFSFVADHFQYLASIGALAGLSAGATLAFKRFVSRPAWVGLAAAAALLFIFGLLASKQGAIYRSPESLWLDTIGKNDSCWMAHENLGVFYAHEGRLDDAIFHYNRALKFRPKDPNLLHDLGTALAKKGDYRGATASFEMAIGLRPVFYEAQCNLGLSLFNQRQYADAARNLREAVRLKGDDPEVRHILALSLASTGDFSAAVKHHRIALQLKPDWPPAMNDLAWLLATAPESGVRDGAQAVRLARRACELTGYREINYLDTLAAASAEAGDYPEAVRIGRIVLDLASSSTEDAAAQDVYRKRLDLYLHATPYHEQPGFIR